MLADINDLADGVKEKFALVYPENALRKIADRLRAGRLDQARGREARLPLAIHTSGEQAAVALFGGGSFCRSDWNLVFGPPVAGGLGPRELLRLVRRPALNLIKTRNEKSPLRADEAHWLSTEALRGRESWDLTQPYSPGYSQRLSALGAAELGNVMVEMGDTQTAMLDLDQEALNDKRRRRLLDHEAATLVYAGLTTLRDTETHAAPTGRSAMSAFARRVAPVALVVVLLASPPTPYVDVVEAGLLGEDLGGAGGDRGVPDARDGRDPEAGQHARERLRLSQSALWFHSSDHHGRHRHSRRPATHGLRLAHVDPRRELSATSSGSAPSSAGPATRASGARTRACGTGHSRRRTTTSPRMTANMISERAEKTNTSWVKAHKELFDQHTILRNSPGEANRAEAAALAWANEVAIGNSQMATQDLLVRQMDRALERFDQKKAADLTYYTLPRPDHARRAMGGSSAGSQRGLMP